MWESSYFFTWGAAIMMMIIMIPMVAVMVSAIVIMLLRGSKSDPSECLWRVLAILLGIIGCKETNMSLPFLHSNKGLR